jgi:hypothetical protein
MIQFALIFGYILGSEVTMAVTTHSIGWVIASVVTYILLFSGKWIERLVWRILP